MINLIEEIQRSFIWNSKLSSSVFNWLHLHFKSLVISHTNKIYKLVSNVIDANLAFGI